MRRPDIPDSIEHAGFIRQVEDLIAESRDCHSADARAQFLTRVRDTLENGPSFVRILTGGLPDAETYETLLAVGADESAVRRLVDPVTMGWLSSRSKDGACIATISWPALDLEDTRRHEFEAIAFATAVLGLLLSAICDRRPIPSERTTRVDHH